MNLSFYQYYGLYQELHTKDLTEIYKFAYDPLFYTKFSNNQNAKPRDSLDY